MCTTHKHTVRCIRDEPTELASLGQVSDWSAAAQGRGSRLWAFHKTSLHAAQAFIHYGFVELT